MPRLRRRGLHRFYRPRKPAATASAAGLPQISSAQENSGGIRLLCRSRRPGGEDGSMTSARLVKLTVTMSAAEMAIVLRRRPGAGIGEAMASIDPDAEGKAVGEGLSPADRKTLSESTAARMTRNMNRNSHDNTRPQLPCDW
jgi:hypothetical protein